MTYAEVVLTVRELDVKLASLIYIKKNICFFHNTWSNATHASLPAAATTVKERLCMMTSSNGNIFRVTGPLCGEFTGPGEFPAQRPVTRSFDAFFDLLLNKRLNKQSWGWWFDTLSRPFWRHRNGLPRMLLTFSVDDSGVEGRDPAIHSICLLGGIVTERIGIPKGIAEKRKCVLSNEE